MLDDMTQIQVELIRAAVRIVELSCGHGDTEVLKVLVPEAVAFLKDNLRDD